MGDHGCCIRGVEEEWILQARRDAQHEAEEEACHSCPQGCEPVHQGALCLQGEACLEDSEGFRHAEAQGGHQLIYGGADSQEGYASACSDAQRRCVAWLCLISSWSFMGVLWALPHSCCDCIFSSLPRSHPH